MSMNDVVSRILSILCSAGAQGLLIDEVATRLGIDLATATTTIRQLVTEKQVMEKSDAGETRYILRAAMGDEAEPGTVRDLNGCPCFHCLRIGRCGIRQPDSPVVCRDLDDWMITSEVQ